MSKTTLTGLCSNPRRNVEVGLLAEKVKSALDCLLPGGASDKLWCSVAYNTRVGYLRSLKKWLHFASAHRIDLIRPEAVALGQFVQFLSVSEASGSIKSTLAGIRCIFQMFNVDWKIPPLVERMVKGIKRSDGKLQDRGAICPHDWLHVWSDRDLTLAQGPVLRALCIITLMQFFGWRASTVLRLQRADVVV